MDPTILKTADALTANGGTDLHAGLTRGYALAQKNYLRDASNRVILVSDGGANLGVVSKNLIARHAKDSGKDGIYLAGIDVVTDRSYYDVLMDAVSDAGKGASIFVHNDAEASRTVVDHVLGTFWHRRKERPSTARAAAGVRTRELQRRGSQ